MPFSKKTRRQVIHKITMRLHLLNKSHLPEGDLEEAARIPQDAVKMADLIEDEYCSKNGAGAIWLDKQLQNTNWISNLQEQSFRQ